MNFNEIQPLPLVCRQSCLNCAAECKRKLFYQYIMGVRLRGTQYKEAATLGKIYHRLQLCGPGKEPEVKAWIRGQQTALMAQVQAGEDLDGDITRLASMLTTLYKKAEVMAHIFWEKFPQPKYLEVVAKEFTHTVEWEGLILEGTIDKLLLNKKSDGDVWIRDHKSTGRPLAVIFGGLPWSSQARIYRILVNDYIQKNKVGQYEAYSVRGFILDGIIKPGIKYCKKDEKNATEWKCSVEEAYFRRVKDWYRDAGIKADCAGQENPKPIDSKGIFYTEPMFSDELVRALKQMKHLIALPIHPDHFDRDITRIACFSYEKRCIYHPLCETDPKQWGSLFDTKFKLINSAEAKNDKDNL